MLLPEGYRRNSRNNILFQDWQGNLLDTYIALHVVTGPLRVGDSLHVLLGKFRVFRFFWVFMPPWGNSAQIRRRR